MFGLTADWKVASIPAAPAMSVFMPTMDPEILIAKPPGRERDGVSGRKGLTEGGMQI